MYDPINWKDRAIEYRHRYEMSQAESAGLVYLIPAPGEVDEPGTPICADNLNRMDLVISAHDKKLENIDEGANNYIHPDTHPAEMIMQDEKHRFVTDEKIEAWDNSLEDAKTYTDGMYRQATGYTDTKIADLIGGAPETLDTLKEVADAIQENETVVEALDAAIGRKANQTELDTHVDNETIHITADERTKWNGYEEEIEGLNNNLTEKQPYLSCGKFTGNIDSVNSDGFGGYLRDNSIVWVHNTEASGTHPDGAEYYILETFSVDLGILTQRAIKYIYQAAPNIFTRIFVNGEWSPWTDTAKLINNATTHYSGPFEIPELGIGYNTELNALIEGGLVPAGKTVELWCNNDTPIGKSVRADIEATYPGADFYGYLEVHRTGDGATVFLTARAFNTLDTYVNRWSSINSVGWQTAWKRI